MPVFYLADPANTNISCVLDIRSLLSKSEVLSTLKQVLSPSISQHIECVQLYAYPTSIDRLGAFVTFHNPHYARQAMQVLRKHALNSHAFGAQLVTSSQQPGYYLPPDIELPTRPFSSFRVIVDTQPHDDDLNKSPSSSRPGFMDPTSSGFSVLNLHGIIDQAELEHVLRLRVTPRVPIVCVQVWRARSSQALHAYITFVCRAHAQWAATQLHGRKGTHTWHIRPLRDVDVARLARPPTEEERASARAAAEDQQRANGNIVANPPTGRLVFSPTAVIVPFYATLLPTTTTTTKTETEMTDVPSSICKPENDSKGTVADSRPPEGRDSSTMMDSWGQEPDRDETEHFHIHVHGDLLAPPPQLRLNPPTPPRPLTLHRPVPTLRTQSQPTVSLLHHHRDKPSHLADGPVTIRRPTTAMALPASSSSSSASSLHKPLTVIEPTLYAHQPIVEQEQDSSLELAALELELELELEKGLSLRIRRKSQSQSQSVEDREKENRFDPFGEAGQIDAAPPVLEGGFRHIERRPVLGKAISSLGPQKAQSQKTAAKSPLGQSGNTFSLQDRVKRR